MGFPEAIFVRNKKKKSEIFEFFRDIGFRIDKVENTFYSCMRSDSQMCVIFCFPR